MEKEYRLLKEGELFEKGDEFFSFNTWRRIPKNWIGSELYYKENNTLSRNKIQIRRKINEE